MTVASEHVAAPKSKTAQPLLVGGALWLAVAIFALFLAVCARYYDYFPSDLRLAHEIQRIDVPAFAGFVRFMNFIGETKTYLVIIVALAIGLGILRAGWEALLVLLSIVPSAVGTVMKSLVNQPRPSAALIHVSVHESEPSFPSGHVLKTGALFLVLFFIIPAVVPWRPARWLLQAGCLLLVVAAGPARVYVGAHWPSDTLESYLLVLLIMGPLLALYLGLRRPAHSESGA
jgi:membrane-associated phospholipid phosphatase